MKKILTTLFIISTLGISLIHAVTVAPGTPKAKVERKPMTLRYWCPEDGRVFNSRAECEASTCKQCFYVEPGASLPAPPMN